MFALLAGFALVFLVIAVVSYLLQALTLFYVFKKVGYYDAYYAFIPLFNIYILSSLVPCYSDGKVYVTPTIGINKRLFRFWWLIAFLVSAIPAIGVVLSVIIRILCYTRIFQYVYSLFEDKDEEDEIVVAIVSAFFPIVFYVKCLIYMINKVQPKHY